MTVSHNGIGADELSHGGEFRKLIDPFANDDPPLISLGVPLLADTDHTSEVVAKGGEALPLLLDALKSRNAKIVMYSAYCMPGFGCCPSP